MVPENSGVRIQNPEEALLGAMTGEGFCCGFSFVCCLLNADSSA
jgi:hypothetical protein